MTKDILKIIIPQKKVIKWFLLYKILKYQSKIWQNKGVKFKN